MKNISIDIESYSSVNLQKAGVYKYVESDDFEILLFGYSIDGGEVQVVDLTKGEEIPSDILDALTDEEVTKWAFNAQFERVCLSRYLVDKGISLNPFLNHHPLSTSKARFLSPTSWKCTMIWAATLGLPMSLEGVGAVLGLDKQKLSEGKNLIKYFCIPYNPTKVNGGRTRNMYFHDEEKWSQFKEYNKRDVEVEMTIQKRLSKFQVPEDIWDEFYLDQEINDRGIAIDPVLVESAIRLEESLMQKLSSITGLKNPNSVLQMRQWLSENGLEMESLGKKEVARELKTASKELAEVLLLRQQLSKSSIKKYTVMKIAACIDNRERGMFRFYGANRTGRFSGRLVQFQNLPQNHLPDLAEARELVIGRNKDALELLYDDIPDTLS